MSSCRGPERSRQGVLEWKRQDGVGATSPIDLEHEAVDDAARRATRKGAGDSRVVFAGPDDGGLVGLGNPGLVTRQERGAHLHSAGAEGERRRDPAPVHDSARRDHGDRDGIDDLGHEGHRPHHRSVEVARKRSPVATGLAALRDDGLDASVFEREGLVDGRRRADQEHPAFLHRIACALRKHAEREAEDRCSALERRSELVVEGAAGRRRDRGRRQPELSVERGHALERRARVRELERCRQRRKEVDAERPSRAGPGRPRRLGDLRRRQVRSPDEPERARLGNSRHEVRRIASTGERRLDDRMLETQTTGQDGLE